MPVSPYTRERVAEAASSSRTLSEALTKLGVDPKSSSRAYLRERMKKPGIDTAHFEREGVRWTREALETAAAASTNMYEVLRRLGVAPVGGQHTHISRRTHALGIDISPFAPQARAENTRGNRRRRPAQEILVEEHSVHAKRTPNVRLTGTSGCCATTAMPSPAPGAGEATAAVRINDPSYGRAIALHRPVPWQAASGGGAMVTQQT
ncbi:HNH endonuclease [Streptomyces sp. Wb2n-11]|uniref:HNH endonuclease n=1 Tax=Streptomyces sp. Wb2n-11 TaxID=1030533 RepID=UPI00210017AD|nr:HNH endonuclease [Streptomyces sp. Wb2n-11]